MTTLKGSDFSFNVSNKSFKKYGFIMTLFLPRVYAGFMVR